MINSNSFFILALTLFASNIYGQDVSDTWNHEIVVTSGMEDFVGDSLYSYSTIVFDAKESEVRSDLINKIKAQTDEKVTRKKVISAMKVRLPKLIIDSIDIMANTFSVEESNNVKVILSFTSEDKVVNPTDFPEADKIAREVLYNLGVKLNKTVVTAEIAKAQTDKSTMENKHLAFSSQKEGLERNLTNAETKLTALEKENGNIKINLKEEKSKEASLRSKADATTSTKEDLEAYDAAKKYIAKVEEQLLKNEQARVGTEDKIKQAQSSIQEKQKELEGLSEQMYNQEKLIDKLITKRDAIM